MTDLSLDATLLRSLLDVAYEQALESYNYIDSQGRRGVPVGAAVFTRDGTLLGEGHNQRVQQNDPATHGETDAFRNAFRNRPDWPAAATFGNAILVTTLSPCLFCCGLIRQFDLGTQGGAVVIGENTNFLGGEAQLEEAGVTLIRMDDERCKELMARYIREQPDVWNEDIGVPEGDDPVAAQRLRLSAKA
jgi:cytosine/creatinine deaminase